MSPNPFFTRRPRVIMLLLLAGALLFVPLTFTVNNESNAFAQMSEEEYNTFLQKDYEYNQKLYAICVDTATDPEKCPVPKPPIPYRAPGQSGATPHCEVENYDAMWCLYEEDVAVHHPHCIKVYTERNAELTEEGFSDFLHDISKECPKPVPPVDAPPERPLPEDCVSALPSPPRSFPAPSPPIVTLPPKGFWDVWGHPFEIIGEVEHGIWEVWEAVHHGFQFGPLPPLFPAGDFLDELITGCPRDAGKG
jgi:hypothetical protein